MDPHAFAEPGGSVTAGFAVNQPTPRRGVWMVIPSFFPLIGGAEAQARRLSAALLHRGWRVRVLTRRDSGSGGNRRPRNDAVDGIRVLRVGSRGPGKIASLQYLIGGLRNLAREGRGDIYHAHDIGTPGLLAAVASHLFDGRSVVKLRTGASVYRSRLRPGPTGWVFRVLLRLHDRIIVVNREVEDMLMDLGVPRHRVVRIPNGIDGSVYTRAGASEKRSARTSLSLPVGGTVVLSVGRLAPVKGIDLLLNAWAMLPEEVRADSTLVIVGDGPARADLARLARSRNVLDSVRIVGARPVVLDYYRAADIFVLPSRAEGLSNALLEAMASGLPVVATAVGGAPDVVEHGISGFLSPPEDADQLKADLLELLSRPMDWPEMGAQGRRHVLEYAALGNVADRLADVYTALAAPRKRSRLSNVDVARTPQSE
jgi:glycosyltransferase involved in cell wall biosynthesis